eukprot:scaffold871_cov340-Prasinococcus_capsulatus_cf.AAC.3
MARPVLSCVGWWDAWQLSKARHRAAAWGAAACRRPQRGLLAWTAKDSSREVGRMPVACTAGCES